MLNVLRSGARHEHSHFLRQFGARLTALSFSGGLAAGSTFVVFVLVARYATSKTLGEFALALAISQGTTQVIDGGYGPVIIREAAGTSCPGAVLSAALKGRVRTLAVGQLLLAPPLALAGWSPASIVLIEALVLASAAYGFVVIVCQATRQFRLLVALQSANAACFVAVGAIAAATLGHLSLYVALGIPVAALAIVDLPAYLFLAGLFREPPALWDGGRDAPVLVGATIANTIASTADSWALGLASPALLAVYAANQRPALVLGIVSAALATIAIPSLARADRETHRRVALWSMRLVIAVPPVAAMAAALGVVILPVAYGSGALVRPIVLGTLVATYAIGMLTVGPSASLVALRRVGVIATAAGLQTAIVVTGMVVAALARSLETAALTLLIGRSAVLAIQINGVYRHSGSTQTHGDVVPA